jgi:DNA-binding NarL/FixJ family response regulator
MIRLVVIDDHPVVRQGLVSVLGDEEDLEVVGAGGSSAEAVKLTEQLHPDVVLLDLELPDLDGVQTIPRLFAVWSNVQVVVFTAYETDQRIFDAIQAGAKGYVLKGAGTAEITDAVRLVHGGQSYLEPRIAGRLVEGVRSRRTGGTTLSDRELGVLRLIAVGMSNKQIARSLGITERTVKFHVTSIFNKLGADNRAQAVAVAMERGLL